MPSVRLERGCRTIEVVRSCGVEVVSSANLVQRFEARWDDVQLQDNIETAKHLRRSSIWPLDSSRVTSRQGRR